MAANKDNNLEGEILNPGNFKKIDSIYLTFENEEEVKCEVAGIFKVNNQSYIALSPEDEEEILLYGYEEKDDEFELRQIEDSQLEKVADVYFDLFGDEDTN